MIPFKHLFTATLIFLCLTSVAQFRLYEKGHDSYKSGKYTEAVQSLTEYLTKSTRDKTIDIDVFYIRALAHYKLNQYQEAIPDFEETLLRGHTNKGNIYWFMAKCYDNLRNYDEAVNSYSNAIRELRDKPESKAKLLFERGEIHQQKGNIELAYLDLRSAVELQPGTADFKEGLAALQKAHPVAVRQAESAAKNPASEKTTVGQNKPVANNEVKKKDTSSPSSAIKQDPGNMVAKKDAEEKAKTATSQKQPEELKTKQQDKDQQPVQLAKNEPVTASENPSSSTVKPAAKTEPAAPEVSVSPLTEFYKDERRFALVIGNSGYPKNIGSLKNPVNDATDMAQELRASNFQVTLLTDATYGQIRAALMKFKESLDGGDPDKTVGLFYYAGHGLQFEDENYLVPVDAAVEYADDIPRYCFPINRMVLANMERSSTRMNIVILDACRNNPFPAVNRSVSNSGLGEMKRARGTFIAYATAPGSVASDGVGKNGLYTQELLKAMRKPGLTIEQVFKEVRMNVLKLSGNNQNTWDSSNIIGEFHFRY